MIKSKKCKLCDKPTFSKGFCQQHSPKSTIKGKSIIKQKSGRKEESKKEQQEKRNVYFDYHIERCTHSELSGKPINEPTRTNICHILPKSTHPSIQDNLDNYLYLSFQEHERFDKLLFSLEFDKIEKEFENILEIICTRSNKFLYLCSENTILKRAFEKWIQNLK